ncbi:MAG TPA: hypothetical protein VEA80_01335 [Vitreimonas sp.]|uniref:hypothetical protein n=1 Tax=Vitreimonas sp. TaxID=3069702 RepID=UPI002D61321B|nr:hypothetical protein [Vitreimonas sp.]HYD86094.1 hypothetical protein [Vitreimonas sp.]
MRFAVFATGAAAIVAVPMALSATGPQMSGDQFLSAVRCTAYEAAAQPGAELGAVKMQLNAEARRQPAETAAQAQAEARAIARQAVISESGADGSMLASAACAGPQFAAEAAADAA